MHCCVCSGSCAHSGGMFYCVAHGGPAWISTPTITVLTKADPHTYVGRHRKGEPEPGM